MVIQKWEWVNRDMANIQDFGDTFEEGSRKNHGTKRIVDRDKGLYTLTLWSPTPVLKDVKKELPYNTILNTSVFTASGESDFINGGFKERSELAKLLRAKNWTLDIYKDRRLKAVSPLKLSFDLDSVGKSDDLVIDMLEDFLNSDNIKTLEELLVLKYKRQALYHIGTGLRFKKDKSLAEEQELLDVTSQLKDVFNKATRILKDNPEIYEDVYAGIERIANTDLLYASSPQGRKNNKSLDKFRLFIQGDRAELSDEPVEDMFPALFESNDLFEKRVSQDLREMSFEFYEAEKKELEKNIPSVKRRSAPKESASARFKRLFEDDNSVQDRHRVPAGVSDNDLPRLIVETFNMGSVELGNWVSQNKERATFLHRVYSGLSQIAEVLGCDKADVGLDGRIHIILGARGRGETKAHLEPHVVDGKVMVGISLPKTTGHGSLFHEYVHAVDCISNNPEFRVAEDVGFLGNQIELSSQNDLKTNYDFVMRGLSEGIYQDTRSDWDHRLQDGKVPFLKAVDFLASKDGHAEYFIKDVSDEDLIHTSVKSLKEFYENVMVNSFSNIEDFFQEGHGSEEFRDSAMKELTQVLSRALSKGIEKLDDVLAGYDLEGLSTNERLVALLMSYDEMDYELSLIINEDFISSHSHKDFVPSRSRLADSVGKLSESMHLTNFAKASFLSGVLSESPYYFITSEFIRNEVEQGLISVNLGGTKTRDTCSEAFDALTCFNGSPLTCSMHRMLLKAGLIDGKIVSNMSLMAIQESPTIKGKKKDYYLDPIEVLARHGEAWFVERANKMFGGIDTFCVNPDKFKDSPVHAAASQNINDLVDAGRMVDDNPDKALEIIDKSVFPKSKIPLSSIKDVGLSAENFIVDNRRHMDSIFLDKDLNPVNILKNIRSSELVHTVAEELSSKHPDLKEKARKLIPLATTMVRRGDITDIKDFFRRATLLERRADACKLIDFSNPKILKNQFLNINGVQVSFNEFSTSEFFRKNIGYSPEIINQIAGTGLDEGLKRKVMNSLLISGSQNQVDNGQDLGSSPIVQ